MSEFQSGFQRLDDVGAFIHKHELELGMYTSSRIHERLAAEAKRGTESWLNAAYDDLALVLGQNFDLAEEKADQTISDLKSFGESLGFEMEGFEEQEENDTSRRIVWRPVARSCLLELFNLLSDTANDISQIYKPLEWSERVSARTDFEKFHRRTALGEAEARCALGWTAVALSERADLRAPMTLYYDDKFLTLHTTAKENEITLNVWKSARQPLAFIPAEIAPILKMDDENMLVEFEAQDLEICPLAPTLQYTQTTQHTNATCDLILSGVVGDYPVRELANCGFTMHPRTALAMEASDKCVRFVNTSGTASIQFEIRDGGHVRVVGGGLVLERDVNEGGVGNARAEATARAGIAEFEEPALDTQILAGFVRK